MLVSAVSRNKWAIFVRGDLGCPRVPVWAHARSFLWAPRVVALLLYLDKPFFRDCRIQRGPEAVLPHGPAEEQLREGRARGHAPGASEKARRRGDPSLTGLLAKPGPSLTRLCYCRLQSEEVLLLLLVIKLHMQAWKMRNRFVFTFL